MANTIKFISKSCRYILPCRSYSVSSENLWTSEKIVKSPYKDIEVPNITIPEHVWKNVERWPDKIAAICGITNRSFTYHQLYKFSRTLAVNFRTKLNIRDGDVICIMKHNSPEFPLAVLGILQAGAEVTTINPIYTAHEVRRQLEHSKPKVIIGSTETVNVIKDALKLAKVNIPIITVKTSAENLPETTISFQELIEDEHADCSILKQVNRKSEDVAIMPYSSGTTGLPKGVELTHRNIVVNCIQQDVEGVKLYQETTASHQESIAAVLPFYHCYGLSVVMLHKLSVGGKMVTLPRFQPQTFLAALRDYRVTLFYAAPPMILFLGSHSDVKKEHLDSVRILTSGAAPLHKPDIQKVFDRKPTINLVQLYGLTETSPLATAMRVGDTNYTTAGYAISNTEMRIADANYNVLGPNEVGELLIRGPQVMKGYRDNPEATKNSITEEGWFKTGDLAFIDDKGVVTIADRLKELIKVKGFQVPPAELENVIKEHPSILDAGVVGIPDQRAGEAPKAFVVLKEGHKLSSEDIKNFVKERLAEYKRLKEVVFMEELPKNPSGKLLRRVLKEKHC